MAWRDAFCQWNEAEAQLLAAHELDALLQHGALAAEAEIAGVEPPQTPMAAKTQVVDDELDEPLSKLVNPEHKCKGVIKTIEKVKDTGTVDALLPKKMSQESWDRLVAAALRWRSNTLSAMQLKQKTKLRALVKAVETMPMT